MYRYIAFVWDAHDPRRLDTVKILRRRLLAHAGWTCVVDRQGLLVCHAGVRPSANRVYPLQDDVGAVLGKLFERQDTDRVTPGDVVLGTEEALAIVKTGGRHLVTRYWGRYVAFLHDKTTNKAFVLRDPTGALPCFGTSVSGIDIYFSRMEDCLQLNAIQFSINWQYVAAHIPMRGPQVRHTGLREVHEVQPGECIEINAGVIRRLAYWDPFQICQTNNIEEPDVAVAALRRTTLACVSAWASCYQHIVHTLSGGLDSSIVLSCLHRASTHPNVTCINYYTPVAEGDERRLARLASQRANCELVESQRDPSSVRLEAVLNISKSPKPWFYLYYLEHSKYEAQIAQQKSAEVIFSGGGGDGLFYQAQAGLSVGDYVKRHGIDRRFFKVALDIAQLERKSIWAVLGNVLKDSYIGRRPLPHGELGKYQTLVNRDVLNAQLSPDYLPASPREANRVPPGKLWHVQSVSVPSSYYDPLGFADAPERLPPLVSQPIVELCLQIPTYVMTSGGWDRAIARRAFADSVPREIITRRDKGGIREHVKAIFQANIPFIRELLLDGLLVQRGFLDRRSLEACLSGRRPMMGTEYTEIQDHISTEAWVRVWSEFNEKAAAA